MPTRQEKQNQYDDSINDLAKTILKQMQKRAGKWEMPWHKGLPQAVNVKTGKFYGGNNQLLLWQTALSNNYKYNQWATFKQWRTLKAMVQKGEKGTLICMVIPRYNLKKELIKNQFKLFEPISKKDSESYSTFFNLKYQFVFNADQVSDYYGNQKGLFDTPMETEGRINELVLNSLAKIIIDGDRAFYSPNKDFIQMPQLIRFKNEPGYPAIEKYQSTLLHELIHWTGHLTRNNRNLLNSFGSEEYAFEELIAELGAAILSSHFNQRIYPREDHAQYLNSWLNVLKNDFSFFTEALELARTAIYYLYDKTGVYPYDLKPQYKREVNEERLKDWKYLMNQ